MKQDQIKLIVLDVDGVLTDGKLFIGSDGNEYKSFHVRDGMGINLARYNGMKIALITGRKSKALHIRAKELKIDFLYEGITDKVKVLNHLVDSLSICMNNVFYMGDDINDLLAMRAVGFSAAPKNAIDLVKRSADFVSQYNGGEGAVRESIEFILERQVDYETLVDDYLNKQLSFIQ